jgi:hypothetical protein
VQRIAALPGRIYSGRPFVEKESTLKKHALSQAGQTRSLGICIGASTLSMVSVKKDTEGGIAVEDAFLKVHHGNPQQLFESAIAAMPLHEYDKVAVTGRKFRHLVNLTSIPEPKAVEEAFLHTNGHGQHVQAIVSAGSETFMLYHLGRDGRISSVHAGNKCASGTGEFFLQQINRIGIGLEDAVRLARSEEPYKVSGRCSVFCKSDCTHATNKGVPKERVTAGLCLMMAGKILELVKKVSSEHVMVIGGCALNSVMIDHLRKDVPDVVIPDEAPYFEALGCALWALKNDTAPVPEIDALFKTDRDTFFHLPPLREAEAMVDFKSAPPGTGAGGGSLHPGSRCRIDDHQGRAGAHGRRPDPGFRLSADQRRSRGGVEVLLPQPADATGGTCRPDIHRRSRRHGLRAPDRRLPCHDGRHHQ